MKNLIFVPSILAICALISSCNTALTKDADDYKNEAVQNVKIGETVKIYYTTNSCCDYCSPFIESMKHLEFVGEEIVIPSPSNCDGCSSTKALLFEAKSIGTDTIVGRVFARSEDCSDTLGDFKSYIVHVQ